MKNYLLKAVCLVAVAMSSLPITANDYLKIYFKDGHTERHYMKLVESISATKYDLKGTLHSDYQMQQITMKDTTYSYYIADIDSMSFTKVDEEQVLKNATAVADAIEPIFNQCETIEEMEQHLDEIKNIDGVENVYSTGTDIVVQVKDWHNIVYNYFVRQEEPIVTYNAKELTSRLKEKANTINSVNATRPKVAIVFQQVDDLSQEWGFNLMIDLKENFERKGFEVTIIADEKKGDEKLDADFYLTRMFDYDMVLLDTHGLSLGGKHALYTGESANAFAGAFLTIENHARNDLDEYGIAGCHVGTERLSDGTYESEIKYYWYVSEDLIKKSSARFKDSGTHIIFIGACEQLKGKEKSITFDDGQTEYYSDSFAQVLFNKGADYIVGYNKKALRGINASNNFYRNLLNGFSLEASLDYLPEIQKKEITVVSDEEAKDARLIGLMTPDADANNLRKYFLFKTKTEQDLSQELGILSGTATTAYPTTKGNPMESSILVTSGEKGYAGTPTKLRCGFRHGLDPNLSKDYQEVYCENPRIEDKTIDNVHFSCNIALPPVSGTYYYQAFTYDGMNYNYGNTCSFYLEKLNDLELSSGSFCINQGESTTITITTGNGDYDIHNSNDKVAIVSVDGEILKIDAVGAGTTTITVTDRKTNQQVSIDVTVWANLSIAIIGNIDLEAGASANVRITSGNNDYTIESSDSTVAIASIVGEFIKVQALSAGKATITITDNKTEQKASFNVTVTEEVANLQVSAQELTLEVGEKASLTITAGSGSYEAKSNNEAVATVSVNGNEVSVIGISAGTAIITVTDTKTGQTALIEVIVVSSGETPDNSVINFADSEVKAICIKNWDTNGDGELSKSEAAAVKDLKRAFRKNSTIINFDELQYFIGLTSIGSNAFSECRSLTSVTIPNTVTCIETSAFSICNLTSITIPNSVTSIESYAFSNNYQLSSVKIPSSVTSLTYSTFAYCTKLTSIDVEEGNLNYTSENGILFDKSKTTIICYPIGKTETSYIIPNSVTKIERMAFCSCSTLTSITIPNSVTTIGEMAFDGCYALTSITIPDAVKTIERATFSGCSSLTSVNIPTSTTYIALSAFYGCKSLTSITISNSVLSIGDNAFKNCKSLTSVIIGNNVTTIGETAFSGCEALASITIPSSVKRIDYGAFGFCSSLTEVHSLIEEPFAIVSVFEYDPLETLYVPKGTKAKYEAIDGWNVFKNIVEM